MIKKLLKSKKGFTLIELIVGLVIFGIISTAVATLLAPTLFAFMRANDFAEYNILLDNIANQIISDLSQSTDPPVSTAAGTLPNDTWNNLSITMPAARVRYTVAVDEDSVYQLPVLHREINGVTSPVFTAEFYRRKLVSFKLESEPNVENAYKLTVRLEHENGNFVIERAYAVRPLILNQHIPQDAEDEPPIVTPPP